MKIGQISKLITLILIVVMSGFGIAVSWSLNHLNDAFSMVEFFGQQKDRIYGDIDQPIFNYLSSGEATLLTDIDRQLSGLKSDIESNAKLSAAVKQSLIGMLDDLERSTLPELRAAGKLADPQVLLINNEQQLSAHLQKLLNYVDQAHAASLIDKQKYLAAIAQTQSALQNLSRARQSYFSARKQASGDTIQHQLQQTNSAAESLEHLPLLGVMKAQSSDDQAFTLGNASAEAKSEDMALEPLAEIRSLLNRYGKELANAQAILQQKLASQTSVNQQMQAFQRQLLTLEHEITEEYQHFERWLYAIVALCMLLIAVVCILMLLVKRHLANLISLVGGHVDKLANGDLSTTLALESRITEINQLKISLQKLHDYFNLLIRNINQETAVLGRYGETIVQGAENLESIIADQQRATETAAGQMAQLSSSFRNVAQNAVDSQSATAEAQQLIEQGVERMNHAHGQVSALAKVMDETANALQLLQQDANAIEGVLGVIQGFTEQTNLLALNAAIEAARAGEHGRGFAVVADEVRKLAAHTAASANQIRALVEKLNRATRNTVALMDHQQASARDTTEAVQDVHQAFAGIKHSVSDISEKSVQIASASTRQSQTVESIAESFVQTAALARRTTDEAQNNKTSAQALSEVSENLHRLVAQFGVE